MKTNNAKYFTKNLLIEACRQGLKWDFNRQIDDRIAEVPDLKYPDVFSFVHEHRHGVRCEPHIRCVISLEPMGGGIVVCDVTRNFFDKLPSMRQEQLLAG